jgi:hypothetical protein
MSCPFHPAVKRDERERLLTSVPAARENAR